MLYDFQDAAVRCADRCFIAPSADVIGMVSLEDRASIWFQAVVRGDTDRISIGQRTNIQDGSILHTDEGIQLVVGSDVTVGHRVILHGCRIGQGSMIGMGAVIMNRAEIGRNCIVAANTLIPEGKEIPDGSVVMGSPGAIVREVTDKDLDLMRQAVQIYVERAETYRTRLQSWARSQG
jgi:carbonic anhydrase/acetyltransferase-like protein (isoleucine patch superfamily)